MSLTNNNHTQASPHYASAKSKKSKSDLLRAVGILLKQKRCVGSEKYRKSDLVLLTNTNNFALQKMLDMDLQACNSFTYSNAQCIINNKQIVDHQFGRFSQFVESQSESLRTELKRFCGPILCHLYLELLRVRDPKCAMDLLKKYAHLVAPVDMYDSPLPNKINGCSVPSNVTILGGANAIGQSCIRFAREAQGTGDIEIDHFMKLIQILSTCTKLEAAENDATVIQFRSSKFELHTTEAVADALSSFLEKSGHVLIMHVIHTWIHVHIIDNELRQFNEDNLFFDGAVSVDDDEDEEDEFSSYAQIDYNKREHKSKVSATKRAASESTIKLEAEIKLEEDTIEDDKANSFNDESCLQALRDASAEIFKSQIDFPRIIKITDKGHPLTAAHIDNDECHMVAGFDNSTIQLWQLNQQRCRGKNFYRRHVVTQCRWELNNCSVEENEESENETETEKKLSFEAFIEKRQSEENKFTGNSFNEYGGIYLRGHSEGITDVRFSAHYPLLYSASKDTTLRTWHAHNYACAGVYRGHDYPIWCMDESPSRLYIATGSKDLSARLWSIEREYALIIYAGHTQDVECIAFHPNGNYLATGSTDHSVRLWCVTSGKLVRVFTDCKQAVTCIAFSPDGKMIAAGGEETKVRIFDLAAGTQLCEFKDHSSSVSSLAWNTQEQHLVSVCNDGSLRIWDVKKLNAIVENGSSTSSSSSSSSTSHRLLALNSSCQSLIKVFYSKSNMLYSIGT